MWYVGREMKREKERYSHDSVFGNEIACRCDELGWSH